MDFYITFISQCCLIGNVDHILWAWIRPCKSNCVCLFVFKEWKYISQRITRRMVTCEIPGPGLDLSWKSLGGFDTAILVLTKGLTTMEVAFYNSSCCTESGNCTCRSRKRYLSNFLFIGLWNWLTPTIGFIGAGNICWQFMTLVSRKAMQYIHALLGLVSNHR